MAEIPTQKIIVYDFDGTIAKTDALMLRLYNEIAPSLSIKEISLLEIDSIKEMTTKQALRHLDIYWYKIPKLWRAMTTAISAHSLEIELNPGMAELLTYIAQKQIAFGVISSNSVENIEAVFSHNNLPTPVFIGSSSALFKKHKTYRKLFKKHNLKLENSIYIGDETRDIEVGTKLSVPVISVSWGFSSKKSLLKAGASTICEDVEDLQNELKHFLESTE